MKVQYEVDVIPIVKATMQDGEFRLVVQGQTTYGDRQERTVTGTVTDDNLPSEIVRAIRDNLQSLIELAEPAIAQATMRARNEAEQTAVRLGEL